MPRALVEHFSLKKEDMSLHRYFARREGLPEANGDLSASVPSRAIALANSEVLKVMVPETKKRGPYKRSV